MNTDTTYCTNCPAQLDSEDAWCRRCGQKVLKPENRRFTSLVRSSFEEVTSVNGRLLPTLAQLVTRPGALSVAYREGRWRRYLTPISIFLLANLVFFVAPRLTDFNLALVDQREFQPYSTLVRPLIDAAVERSGQSFDEFSVRYQLRVTDVAKIMVILHVPLLALATFLLFADRRFLYADHVVCGLHFFAFLMLYFTLAHYALLPSLDALVALSGYTGSTFMMWLLLPLIYIPLMLKRAFDVGWPRALLSTVGFLVALIAVHMVFRAVQLLLVLALLA